MVLATAVTAIHPQSLASRPCLALSVTRTCLAWATGLGHMSCAHRAECEEQVDFKEPL